ncbi:MAG: endonuclease [Bacilli bacterium]|nr:endonuclease [Bacilli bacterium]
MKKSKWLLSLLSVALLCACAPNNSVSSPEASSQIPSEPTVSTLSESASDATSELPSSPSSETPSATSSQAPVSTSTPATDSRWNVNFAHYGETFMNELGTLIRSKSTKNTGYNELKNVLPKSDASPDNSSLIVPFYHDKSAAVTPTWNSIINREHVWPDSRAGSCAEGDPHMTRPTLMKENSSRGNNFYGPSTSNQFDPGSLGFEAARGEAARIIMYTCAKFHASNGLVLSNNPGDATSAKSMGTLKYLVQWNNQYPATEMEILRNDRLEAQGYGRNPFIDHPEYANWIWNEQGYVTSVPGGVPTSGGETTSSQPSGYTYTLVDALADLENAQIAIAGSQTGSDYFSLTSEAKSASLPWYLVGQSVVVSGTSMNSIVEAEKFTFAKGSDGKFTVKASNGKYLCNYISGTHYSVGFYSAPSAITEADTASEKWDITLSNGEAVMKGEANVYLEYYSGSFCGYKSAPSVALRLFK